MHPQVAHVLQYFECGHLPERLQDVVRPYQELAKTVAERSPSNPETTIALRYLLISKDAAVRAAL